MGLPGGVLLKESNLVLRGRYVLGAGGEVEMEGTVVDEDHAVARKLVQGIAHGKVVAKGTVGRGRDRGRAIFLASSRTAVRVWVAQSPLGTRCRVQLGSWGAGEGEITRPAEAEVASIGWVELMDRGAEICGWGPPADGRGNDMMSG